MRLDRIVTVTAFRAAGGLTKNNGAVPLPVLMYHSISATPETAHPYYQTSTHPLVFAEHMRVLESWGYRGVSLSEGLQAVVNGCRQRDARRPVAITFDDGFRDFADEALPVLQRHGFRATMYLPTDYIAHERRRFKNRECLTWGEVSELHNAGFEFGSHTASHPRLVDLSWEQVRRELAYSKAAIEDRLGAAVSAFAYPYAFPSQKRHFTERLIACLKESGYRSAVTTLIGQVNVNDDAFCLKRIPVNSCDDEAFLCAKLRGFYNWMGRPQLVAKYLKGII
jgi:peptidoglycan/xylan/chitin deacetylase (PgdA/CDA1 family)